MPSNSKWRTKSCKFQTTHGQEHAMVHQALSGEALHLIEAVCVSLRKQRLSWWILFTDPDRECVKATGLFDVDTRVADGQSTLERVLWKSAWEKCHPGLGEWCWQRRNKDNYRSSLKENWMTTENGKERYWRGFRLFTVYILTLSFQHY